MQNVKDRTPEARRLILEQLWARGRKHDPAAIERLRTAHPDTPTPGFLCGPPGYRLSCAPAVQSLPAAIALYRGERWCLGLSDAEVLRGQRAANAWVAAYDAAGTLVATARALADGVRFAWISDVAVLPAHRGRGLGRAIMRLLLDHPALREVRDVRLRTSSAEGLYKKLGFSSYAIDPNGRIEMWKQRAERVEPLTAHAKGSGDALARGRAHADGGR